MRPFTLNYARPRVLPAVVTPYRYDSSMQLNVLPDGRPAVSDRELLLRPARRRPPPVHRPISTTDGGTRMTVLILTSEQDVTADMVVAELHLRSVPVMRLDPADVPGKAVLSADYAHGDFDGHLSVNGHVLSMGACVRYGCAGRASRLRMRAIRRHG